MSVNGTGVGPKGNPDGRNRVAVLVLANFLASVGGGRVLSAGKGLTSLIVLGSGSLLALLVGSVISLFILRLARRSLVGVSAASAVCSAGLIWIYRRGTGAVATAAVAGGPLLSGCLAWLFFSGLVCRCALWFAGRSLRTGLVSSVSRPGLALSEAAYFGGLVAGLLIGLPAWLRGDAVASAFTLDIALLAVATFLDLGVAKAVAPVSAGPIGDRRSRLPPRVFAILTAAYATATIGCQIVVFQLADALARSSETRARVWSDPSLAAFYVGVAAMAVASFALRPALAMGPRGWPVVGWGRAGEREQGTVPVATLCLLAGTLIVAGVLVLFAVVGSPAAADRTLPALTALAAIAAGAGLFEMLALAVLGLLATGGQQAVAVALGLAAAAATAAMFLMLLAGVRPGMWAGVNAAGLVAALWLLKQLRQLPVAVEQMQDPTISSPGC